MVVDLFCKVLELEPQQSQLQLSQLEQQFVQSVVQLLQQLPQPSQPSQQLKQLSKQLPQLVIQLVNPTTNPQIRKPIPTKPSIAGIVIAKIMIRIFLLLFFFSKSSGVLTSDSMFSGVCDSVKMPISLSVSSF